MHLAQDNDVVHTLTPDRSDQPLGEAILPRRGGRNRLIPDAHGAQSACDDRTIDAIPVAEHVARSFIPRECFGDLARNPFRGRMCCDADPDQLSAIQPHSAREIAALRSDAMQVGNRQLRIRSMPVFLVRYESFSETCRCLPIDVSADD